MQHTHPLFLREGNREAAVLKGGKSPCSAGRIDVSFLNKRTCKAIWNWWTTFPYLKWAAIVYYLEVSAPQWSVADCCNSLCEGDADPLPTSGLLLQVSDWHPAHLAACKSWDCKLRITPPWLFLPGTPSSTQVQHHWMSAGHSATSHWD